jgi:thiamine-phosphate pyrophosphorylase
MKSLSENKLRIIDANLNRIGEGLRVLEEFARLSLNDAGLTGRLKNLRHEMVHVDKQLQQQLLLARDAAGDVGADMEAPGQEKPRDATGTIVANARRVQESLRVMEELAREAGSGLKTESYRKARFALYTIEKELLAGMLRRDKLERLKGLYVIIDAAFLKGRNVNDATMQAIRGGARIIQYRDKEHGIREILAAAGELKEICSQHDVLFIVNDSLEVALAVDADGLHVGRDDLPVATARRLLPIDKVLGASARTIDEAKKAQSEGADYLGVGAMYATSTKAAAEVVGPGRIKEIKNALDIPVVAIGGINESNLSAVMKAGADAAAVISAVMGVTDVEKAVRRLTEIIKGEERERPR